jgi:hypothetical protein
VNTQLPDYSFKVVALNSGVGIDPETWVPTFKAVKQMKAAFVVVEPTEWRCERARAALEVKWDGRCSGVMVLAVLLYVAVLLQLYWSSIAV